jgi:hypothetical protein
MADDAATAARELIESTPQTTEYHLRPDGAQAEPDGDDITTATSESVEYDSEDVDAHTVNPDGAGAKPPRKSMPHVRQANVEFVP